MAYGGRTYSNVSVDIVQADVDAIIDGLTGGDGRNLSDVDARLAGLHDLLAGYTYSPLNNGVWAADYLANIQGGMDNAVDLLSGNYYGPLVDTAYSAMVAADCLRGYETGPFYDGYNGAVDWLNWIESDMYELVSMLSGWYPSVLSTTYSSTVDYLDWIYGETSETTSFLAGWNSGPLTDTADRLYDWYSGQNAAELLRDINYSTGETPYLLYDGWAGRSAAELLSDIREALWQFTFDYDGRLRVTTTD